MNDVGRESLIGRTSTICVNPLSVAIWRLAEMSLTGSSKLIMRTQNNHAPSSRFSAVAPLVKAYPLAGDVDSCGVAGVALTICEVIPTRDKAPVRKNNRLVVMVLFRLVAFAVGKCRRHYIYQLIVGKNTLDIRQLRKLAKTVRGNAMATRDLSATRRGLRIRAAPGQRLK